MSSEGVASGVGEALPSLLRGGFAHMRGFINPDDLHVLKAAINGLQFTSVDEVVSTSNVKQKYQWARIEHDALQDLIIEIEQYLTDEFKSELISPIIFNELIVQMYKKGDGITPHKDGKKYIGVVAIIILDGKGDFYVCKDRSGSNKEILDGKPGDVILLRGSDFGGQDMQPFHGIENVQEGRCVLTMRQSITR